MMRRISRVIIGATLALAVAAGAGLVTQGLAGSDSGSSGKSPAAGSSCPSAKAGTCPSAKAAACPSAAKGCPGAAVGGCPSSKGAAAGQAGCPSAVAGSAGALVLPEGTRMNRLDVEGGVDFVFTGKDLAGIRACLDGYIAACNATKESPCSAQECVATTTENSVVLSMRGANAANCSAMLTAAVNGEGTKPEPAKPAKKKWSSWWKR